MDGNHEVSREKARSLAKRWVWIILRAQFLVLYIPLLSGLLFYHFTSKYEFGGSGSTKNWINHWWEIPIDFLALLLLPMMFGWAFFVYAGMAWKRLARAQTGIGEMERGVKAGLFALATPHVIGNFFMAPFYFLSGQHPGSAAIGLSFYSVFFIPPIGLLLAKLKIPRVKKGP